MNLLESHLGKPVESINVKKLDEKLKNGKKPFVLDVRQPAEYQSGHITGAKLIPLGELRNRMNELPENREIVCVCASGNRSGSATRMLTKAGFEATNMQGGMLAWQRSNLPIKKGNVS